MSLLHLPSELVLITVTFLETQRDINSLCLANRRIYSLLNSYLYRINPCSSRPALVWATLQANEGTARLSIQEGAEPEWIDAHGRGLLCLAVKSRHDAIVRILLGTGKINVDLGDSDGRTPL